MDGYAELIHSCHHPINNHSVPPDFIPESHHACIFGVGCATPIQGGPERDVRGGGCGFAGYEPQVKQGRIDFFETCSVEIYSYVVFVARD